VVVVVLELVAQVVLVRAGIGLLLLLSQVAVEHPQNHP